MLLTIATFCMKVRGGGASGASPPSGREWGQCNEIEIDRQINRGRDKGIEIEECGER